MDRYMNDTHSLYYNVDHSSMFGSNLSTVFADGPPPLEDSLNDDDHGEFVFSSETDAIGQAVLNKIESKLKKDAETRSAGGERENSSLGSDIETKPNSSTEKFEAFANFEASIGSNHFGTLEKSDIGAESGQEVNGFEENITNNVESGDGFSDDEFGDFSAGFSQTSNLNINNKPDIDKHNGSFSYFSAFQNNVEQTNKSEFISNEQTSSSGEGAKESNNFQFADFGSFNSADLKESDWGQKCNDNTALEGGFGNNSHADKMRSQIDKNDTSDDEFASFEEADDGDFGAFTTNKVTKTGESEKINPKPDVIPTTERDNLTSPKLPHDLTSHEAIKTEVAEPFEAFKDDTQCKKKSGEFPPHLTNYQTEDTNGFGTFKDNSFDDFANTNDEGFGDFSQSFQTSDNQSQNNESQAPEMFVLNSDKNKTKENVSASTVDDDFGDFADFSNDSFNAVLSDNFRTDSSKTPDKVLPENNSNSAQNSGEFTAFSEATSSKREHKFASNSESTVFQKSFQADFCAFSESASSKNKQVPRADFGAFSQSSSSEKSFAQSLSSKQSAGLTPLVSFHACFQDVFVTLHHKVEDLQHVKIPGEKRLNQEKLWENLHSNMGEGALRFSWEQCKTSDKTCKALEVSKKHIVVNPNILAMSEGLEIPVFAAGLGILQPSIVPSPPKKKKGKVKKEGGSASETLSGSSTPPASHQTQAVITEFKTDHAKDSNSDTASLSNSDTASLDLDFFASAPSNVSVNSDPSTSNSLYNLEFAFGPVPPGNQADLAVNRERELDFFKSSKAIQDDPLKILKKLDTSKMSSSVVNESRAKLSSRASGIIGTFEDLSFMHSSVLMFPLHKNN